MGQRRGVGAKVRAGVALAAVIAVTGCENGAPPVPTVSGQSSSGPSITLPLPSTAGPTGSASGGAPTVGASNRTARPTPAPAPSSGAPVPGGQEVSEQRVTVMGQVQTVRKNSATIRTARGATTVVWDGGTVFLDTTAAERASVRAGVCAVASTALVAPGEQRTGPEGADVVVWVLVSAPLDGHCPAVAPQAPGASGAARILSGLVSRTKGSVVTLETVGVGRPTARVRIALANTATIVETRDATSAVLRKGRCVVAVGTSPGTGRVVATSLTVSDAGRAGCPG